MLEPGKQGFRAVLIVLMLRLTNKIARRVTHASFAHQSRVEKFAPSSTFRRMKSQKSLINSLPSYHSTELADRDALNQQSGLQSLPWLEAYRSDPANEPVLTCGAMLSNNAKLPPDHIVRGIDIAHPHGVGGSQR